MDNLNQAKNQISALLSESSAIGIVISDKHNLDLLASALSLHLILQDSGKNSQVVSHKDPTVEHSFLVGIDQLTHNFSGLTKTLTVSFPYHDGDIEKVSYNIEGDRLNVNLFAEEQGIRFTEKDVRYIRQGSAPQLIFTLGISNISEVSDLVDPAVSKVINIDTSTANTLFGDAMIVDPTFSSYSEIIAKLALELGLQIEFDVAQNLLDGIASATQNFSSPKTSPTAFEMVGVMMQKGAVRKNMKDAGRTQSQDTSLQMLGNQPKQQPKPQQFNQPKPFSNGSAFAQAPADKQKFNAPKQFNQQPSVMQNTEPVWQAPSQPAQQPRQQFEDIRPQQPRPLDTMPQSQPAPQEDINMGQIPQVPSEDEAPTDWFTPKVFKSNKN